MKKLLSKGRNRNEGHKKWKQFYKIKKTGENKNQEQNKTFC